MFIRKLKKEMTECRIIQVQKFLHETKFSHPQIGYNQVIKQKIQLCKGTRFINLYLKVTNKCNFNCYFCSQNCSDYGELSFADAKRILDDVHKLGFINIFYTGGEPLLNKDINKILKYGRTLGFNQCLVTNGYLIDKYPDIIGDIDKFGISLHGDSAVYEKIIGKSNTYQKIIENILLLRAQNKNVEINYTLCEENNNVQQLAYVADFCKKEKLQLSVARLNYVGKAKHMEKQNVNELCKYIDTLNDKNYSINVSNCIVPCVVENKYQHLCHGCGAGITTIAVDYSGNVTICASSDKVIGNVLSGSFKVILHKIEANEKKRIKDLPQCCRICKLLVSCKGGCKIECENSFSCDYLLNDEFETFCKFIYDKYIILKTNKFLIKNQNIILPVPFRSVDNRYQDVLMKLNGSMTGNQIISSCDDQNEILQLLFCLYKDNYLLVREDRL